MHTIVKKRNKQKFVLDSKKITTMEFDDDFIFIEGDFKENIKKFDQGVNSHLSCTESEVTITKINVSEAEMKPLIKYLCKLEPKFKSLKEELENQTFKAKKPHELREEEHKAFKNEFFPPKPKNTDREALDFCQDYPLYLSTLHRGHFEKISMKKIIDARIYYGKRNYQEALKCLNALISEHIESNPYPLFHEKSAPPKLYYDAYYLKGLCLMKLEEWTEASIAIGFAHQAADLLYAKDSSQKKEIQLLLDNCLSKSSARGLACAN